MLTKKSQQRLLARLLLMAESKNDMDKLLGEIFSNSELNKAAQRITVTKELLKGKTYREIERDIGASTYVIYRTKTNIVNSDLGLTKGFLRLLGEIDG